MSDLISMQPVAFVRGGRARPTDDSWDREIARIELAPPFGPEALTGLADFSHAKIVFVFDRVNEDQIVRDARHPRGRADWPLAGIFAQRGKNRPNRIGVTACRLLAVEGASLLVQGLDAIDGTPVLDIKPVMKGFLPRGEIRQPRWADEIMAQYW